MENNDEATRRRISLILKFGSYGSAFLLLAGVILALFRPAPSVHYPLRELAGRLARLDATAIMQAGIALLLVTPVVRIVAAIVSFAGEGDHRYAWIATGVLLIVVSSVLFRIAL